MSEQTRSDAGASAEAGNLESLDIDVVFQRLDSSEEGLTNTEAASRIEQYGLNRLEDRQISPILQFLGYFRGPIAWMIELAALMSALVGHWADFSIILTLLLYNAVSGFWQEHKAANALSALKAGMAPTALASRDGVFATLDAARLVPGDVLRIKLGQVVPADVRFISGDYISIDQAALTGESLPVNKKSRGYRIFREYRQKRRNDRDRDCDRRPDFFRTHRESGRSGGRDLAFAESRDPDRRFPDHTLHYSGGPSDRF